MWLNDPERLKRLYPPRAEVTMNPARLQASKRRYIAQYKYNDVRTLIFLFPGEQIELLTRQRESHKGYRLSNKMKRALLSLDLSRDRSHVLDGGILRNLLVGDERPIVLWDILVHEGEYLIGTTYEQRYALLKRICREPGALESKTGREIGLKIREALWLAPLFKSGFDRRFEQALPADYLEGLMLKDPRGKLERGILPKNNMSWQVKVRKPRKDYIF